MKQLGEFYKFLFLLFIMTINKLKELRKRIKFSTI